VTSGAGGGNYLVTIVGSAGVLALNLMTGVLSARLLAPEGRGAVGAISEWVLTATVVSGLGFRDGLGYLQSRDEGRSGRLLTAGLVSVFVLSAVGLVVTELLIGVGFAAQSEEVVRQARIFMVWILPYSAYFTFGKLLASRHQFAALSVLRVGQPLIYAVVLLALWVTGSATVATVLSAQILSFVMVSVWAFLRLYRSGGIGPLDPDVVRESATFGGRAYGATLGSLAVARLDLVLLPAFIVADEIGLYVVAVSAATMIVGLFGSMSLVVFPTAARAGGNAGAVITQRALRAVLLGSVLVTAALALCAPFLLRLLYGAEFVGASDSLRLLLPGACCLAGSQILSGGLSGLNRPGLASIAHGIGALVTLVGLVTLLPVLGIIGAALVSTAAYALVFAIQLVFFSRASGTRVFDAIDPVAGYGDLRWMVRSLGHRARSMRGGER
jgi:O-antigen/teichoic acid export membrane protein